MDPTGLDVVFLFELFNTNCTEVTPGSNIVRKDLDQNWFSIFFCIQWVRPLYYGEFAQELQFYPLSLPPSLLRLGTHTLLGPHSRLDAFSIIMG